MSGRGLRHRVILRGFGIERAIARQTTESARQLTLPAIEIIGPQLVDGDHDHELGPLLCGQRRRRDGCEQERVSGWFHVLIVACTVRSRGSRIASMPATATT